MSHGKPMEYRLPDCESCAALRQQLAEVTADRDAYYTSMNEAHAEAMRDKELLDSYKKGV